MTVLGGLRSNAPADRLAAIDELVKRQSADDDELRALVQCLGDLRKAVVRSAADALATLSACGTVRELLIGSLRDATFRQRWGAAFALSRLGAPPAAALPVLLECLGSDDGDIRWAAADIIVRMHGQAGLIDPLRALLHTGNVAQRKMAAYCLRDLDARSADIERALFAALDDGDAAVRMAAMSSLTRLTADRAAVARRVSALLSDPDDGIRRAAAAILGALGERSEPILAALRTAAADRDPSLQRAAARSLRLLQS